MFAVRAVCSRAAAAAAYSWHPTEVASEPVSSSSVAMVRRAPLTTQPAVPLTASLSQVKPGMVWQKVSRG